MHCLKRFISWVTELGLVEKVACPLLLVVLIFLLTVALAPVHQMKEYESLARHDSLFNVKAESVYRYPEMSALAREKAYTEALLRSAATDSIQLSVNLSDSAVCLYIKGVRIHQTRIREFRQDRLLGTLPAQPYMQLFSQPLKISAQYATIVKEPIVVRNAPKDTAEAAMNAWQPDTLLQNPAFLWLRAEHCISLVFEQDENPTFHDRWTRFRFYSHLRAGSAWEALSRFFTFRKQEYHPTVTIKMPVDSLRAVYRALPHNACVVLKTDPAG
jgi:hypothetical protein